MSITYDDNIIVDKAFKDLLKYCNRSRTEENKVLLLKGFRFANNAHKGVTRKSGEPYILHPIAVAKIVAKDIGLGTEAVVTALLHDVVEDTDYTLEDIESIFGEKITYMVDGLTKIDGVFDTEYSKQAENFKKILLTLSSDIRIILIKIADRLHNMRTLRHMKEHKQIKIANETLTLFAPLAHRFGLRSIRKELESLSFKYLNKEDYESIEKQLESENQIRKTTADFAAPIREKLDQANYTYRIEGNQKSIYSIWTKMQEQNCTFEELFDKLAVRIIFTPKENISEIAQCWDIHSIIQRLYKIDETKTRNWINYPRPSGYEALRLIVLTQENKWIEVQICSTKMNQIVERGSSASYWRNKQQNKKTQELDKWLNEVSIIFENTESEADAKSFLDDFKLELYYEEIQVFSPKGEIITLPQGATILDFAYKIHSELGNKCIGAKVDKKLQPINYKLSRGEHIEILTLQNQTPKIEWLDYVVTARAKTKLKSIFKNKRLEKIKEGQQLLEDIFKRNNFPKLDAEIIKKLLTRLKVRHKDNLYLDIANRIISEKDIKTVLLRSDKMGFGTYFRIIRNPLKKRSPNKEETIKDIYNWDIKTLKNTKFTLRDDKVDEEYKIAKCCQPIPGDDVIAYIDLKNHMIVHKKKCSRILQLSSRKNNGLIPVKWETRKIKSFLTIIEIKGIESHGMVNQISNVISNEHKVNMKSISITEEGGLFSGEIKLYIPHKKDLKNIIQKLSKIKGVLEVKRKETI